MDEEFSPAADCAEVEVLLSWQKPEAVFDNILGAQSGSTSGGDTFSTS